MNAPKKTYLQINIAVTAAAALSALTLAAHIFGGDPQYHVPAMASNLNTEEKALYSVLWHAVTVILLLNSLALGIAAKIKPCRLPLVSLVAAQYAGWGILFVYYGQTRLGELWSLPQWIAFFLIPTLALWGLRKKAS
ncbi:MAG: hypothetical protein L3J13_06400 [Devosiaceae bacterium]|nr:hypothetical protein [Devosiaceae bacterium]